MKEPIISDLEHVTEKMINALETWLADELYGWCPFRSMNYKCERHCYILFENLGTDTCPCHLFGQDETVLAFSIICDVWPVYNKKKGKP